MNLCLWDIESPQYFDPRLVVRCLEWFFHNTNLADVKIEAVVGKLESNRIPIYYADPLCFYGVELTSLNDDKKGSADNEIKARMYDWSTHNDPGSTLTVMTGDGGFRDDLDDLVEMGFQTIVIHPSTSSTSHRLFGSYATTSFEDIIHTGFQAVAELTPSPFFGAWGPRPWNSPWVGGPEGGVPWVGRRGRGGHRGGRGGHRGGRGGRGGGGRRGGGGGGGVGRGGGEGGKGGGVGRGVGRGGHRGQYYDDVAPPDYKNPLLRECTKDEAQYVWTKNPLRMETGNVNSKQPVLTLKVKSVLDPCEDENDDMQDDGKSVGPDSISQTQENQFIGTPVEILDLLVREGVLSKTGKDTYIINNKDKTPENEFTFVKDEADGKTDPEDGKPVAPDDYMYMKARYHSLSMKYATVTKLQNMLDGEASQTAVQESYVEPSSNCRLESMCGGIHSIGSEVTRTKGRSGVQQNGSVLSEQTISKAGNNKTPSSTKAQPVASRESFAVNGAAAKEPDTVNCSQASVA